MDFLRSTATTQAPLSVTTVGTNISPSGSPNVLTDAVQMWYLLRFVSGLILRK
jgi:hypothetical protein